MRLIFGIDLGKFKSVACLHAPDTAADRFAAVHINPGELRAFLESERLRLVVFEPHNVAGCVANLCPETIGPAAEPEPDGTRPRA